MSSKGKQFSKGKHNATTLGWLSTECFGIDVIEGLGYVGLDRSEHRNGQGYTVAVITDMVVEEEKRGKGYGTAIINLLLTRCHYLLIITPISGFWYKFKYDNSRHAKLVTSPIRAQYQASYMIIKGGLPPPCRNGETCKWKRRGSCRFSH